MIRTFFYPFGHCFLVVKGQTQSPNSKEHATLFLAQNNPSNLTAKILSMTDYFNEKKFRPLDESLG